MEPSPALKPEVTDDSLKSMQTVRAHRQAGMIGQEEDINLRLPDIVLPQKSDEESVAPVVAPQAKPSLPSSTKPKAQPSYRGPGRTDRALKRSSQTQQPETEQPSRDVTNEMTPQARPVAARADKAERRTSTAVKEEKEQASSLLPQAKASLQLTRAGRSPERE